MGGSGSKPQVDAKIPGNNNKGDIVLIPVDPSKQAAAAFEWYAHHMHRPENKVYVIHSPEFQADALLYTDMKVENVVHQMDEAQKAGQKLLQSYQKKLQDLNINGDIHIEHGKPGEAVISAADKLKATHIVMGTRGFGIIRRSILGSVSEYVIHHTNVPVTVVPKETTNWFF